MSSFDEKVLQFFSEADKDKSNSISTAELIAIFRKCGDKHTDAEIKALFAFIDKNKDNSVSLEELKAVLAKQPPKQKKEAELRAAFREIDTDGSGTINVKELQAFLTKMEYDDNVKDVIALADKNGDGNVSFEEFVALLD